eukprot:scaffold18790_cov49-Phaeocystis_antarctica.AAC.1
MGWRPRRPTFEWMVSVCTQHTASPGSLLRRSRQSTTSLSAPPVATKPVTLTSIESTGSLPCHAICGVIALQGTAGGMVVRGVGYSRLARREEGRGPQRCAERVPGESTVHLRPRRRSASSQCQPLGPTSTCEPVRVRWFFQKLRGRRRRRG